MVMSLTRNRAQMQNTNTYHRHGDMAMRRRGVAVENVGMPTFLKGGEAAGRSRETREMRRKAGNQENERGISHSGDSVRNDVVGDSDLG